MTSVEEAAVKPVAIAPVARLWPQLRYVVTRHPLGVFGAAIMAIFVFAAVFADLLTRYDPVSTNAALSLARPDAAHPFGADFMGRDVYSRIIYGARISLAVGLGATALGCALGVALGLVSGFLGGWVDLVVQRLVDVMQALPGLGRGVAASRGGASAGVVLATTFWGEALGVLPARGRGAGGAAAMTVTPSARGGAPQGAEAPPPRPLLEVEALQTFFTTRHGVV